MKKKCLHCGLEDFTVVIRDRPLTHSIPHDTLEDAKKTIALQDCGIIIRVSKNLECQKAIAWRRKNERSIKETGKRWFAKQLEDAEYEQIQANAKVTVLRDMIAKEATMLEKYANATKSPSD